MISDYGGDGESDCGDDEEEEKEGIWKELSHDYQDENYKEPSLV